MLKLKEMRKHQEKLKLKEMQKLMETQKQKERVDSVEH
jgi:hypothetical protein